MRIRMIGFRCNQDKGGKRKYLSASASCTSFRHNSAFSDRLQVGWCGLGAGHVKKESFDAAAMSIGRQLQSNLELPEDLPPNLEQLLQRLDETLNASNTKHAK